MEAAYKTVNGGHQTEEKKEDLGRRVIFTPRPAPKIIIIIIIILKKRKKKEARFDLHKL